MKFLIRATIPVVAGNAFVKSAGWQGKMDQIMGDIKPETAYFTLDRGQRTLYLPGKRGTFSPTALPGGTPVAHFPGGRRFHTYDDSRGLWCGYARHRGRDQEVLLVRPDWTSYSGTALPQLVRQGGTIPLHSFGKLGRWYHPVHHGPGSG